MRLAPIVVKLRHAETRFKNMIAGAAELAIAQEETFTGDLAFVVPLGEATSDNWQDSGLIQKITESFAVVVAMRNDRKQRDKTGLGAYDLMEDVRRELFGAILNWHPNEMAVSPVVYRGGNLLDISPAYMWYQFDFSYDVIVTEEDGAKDPNWADFLRIFTEYMATEGIEVGPEIPAV